MRAVLIVQEEGTPRRHPVPRKAVIGRDPACDVVLADPTVSRRHAVLESKGDVVRLRDLKSGNGTFVDGEAVADAELAGGERLRFGGVCAELRLEEPSELSASQKLRQTFSVAPARRTRPVAAVVASAFCVLALVLATAWEKGCGRAGTRTAGVQAPAAARG